MMDFNTVGHIPDVVLTFHFGVTLIGVFWFGIGVFGELNHESIMTL
jgi:hypothetical protein